MKVPAFWLGGVLTGTAATLGNQHGNVLLGMVVILACGLVMGIVDHHWKD